MSIGSQESNEVLPLLPSSVPRNEPKSEESRPAATKNDTHQESLGRLLQVLGALCYAIGDVTTRFLQANDELAASQILFCVAFSNFLGAILYLTIVTSLRTVFSAFRRIDYVMLGLRGLAGAITMYTIVRSLQYLPSGDAIAILFSGPIMLIFLSYLFLGEPIETAHVIATVVGFIGVVIVSRPDSSAVETAISAHDRIVGTAFGLASALGTSFIYITVRKLVTSVHFMTSMLSLGFSSLIMATLLGGFVTPAVLQTQLKGVLISTGSGFVLFIGQCSISYGLQFCLAGTALMMRNLEVLFVYILGLIVLHEFPTPLRAVGAAMVVSGAVIVSVAQIMRAKAPVVGGSA